MNKRQHNRFVITLHTRVTVNGDTYEGIIGNVSEEGISSTITTYVKTDSNFSPHKAVTLNFNLPSGEPVTLEGKVRWFLKPSEDKETLILGLYIEDPPPRYKEWLGKFR